MTTFSARSVRASRHALDHTKRIDTLLLRYPRWIHAELMTHRVFSRNASSSRAIPVEKLIQQAIDDPARPTIWTRNEPGMQGFELLTGDDLLIAQDAWEKARHSAIAMARVMASVGAHKQLVNRLLEPFTHITVVVTSTNWSNFLHLRDHPDAEPHIQLLAKSVRWALEVEAEVRDIMPGEWHRPFTEADFGFTDDELLHLSVARCASTSYKTVDGFDMSLERAKDLHTKLVGMDPLHASPCEHQAMADTIISHPDEYKIRWLHPELGGNLGPGFIQYRKTLVGECR